MGTVEAAARVLQKQPTASRKATSEPPALTELQFGTGKAPGRGAGSNFVRSTNWKQSSTSKRLRFIRSRCARRLPRSRPFWHGAAGRDKAARPATPRALARAAALGAGPGRTADPPGGRDGAAPPRPAPGTAARGPRARRGAGAALPLGPRLPLPPPPPSPPRPGVPRRPPSTGRGAEPPPPRGGLPRGGAAAALMAAPRCAGEAAPQQPEAPGPPSPPAPPGDDSEPRPLQRSRGPRSEAAAPRPPVPAAPAAAAPLPG